MKHVFEKKIIIFLKFVKKSFPTISESQKKMQRNYNVTTVCRR